MTIPPEIVNYCNAVIHRVCQEQQLSLAEVIGQSAAHGKCGTSSSARATAARDSIIAVLRANVWQRQDHHGEYRYRIEYRICTAAPDPDWQPLSSVALGRLLGVDHATVLNSLKRRASA